MKSYYFNARDFQEYFRIHFHMKFDISFDISFNWKLHTDIKWVVC